MPRRFGPRNEDDEGGRRRGEERGHDLSRASFGGLHGRVAALPPAVNVLDHDDRVVDHEPEADGEPHHREEVEREAAEVDEGERAANAEDDGREDEPRRAERAEKREEDAEDDEGGEGGARAQVAELLADFSTLVELEDEGGAIGVEPLEVGHARLDRVGHADRVRPDLPRHRKAHCRLSVDAGERCGLLVGVVDLGHVGHAHRLSADRRDDRATHVLGAPRSVHDRDAASAFSLADRARLAHEIEIAHGIAHLGRSEPERSDALLVEADFQEAAPPAGDTHERHSVHPQDLGHHDLVEMQPERFERVGTGEGVFQERTRLLGELLGHVGLHGDLADARRKRLLERRDPLRKIEAGEVHVGQARELDLENREVLHRRRRDVLDASYLLDARLERGGEERLDRLRRSTRPGGADREARELLVREHLEWNVAPRRRAEQRDGRVGHGNGHRAVQTLVDHVDRRTFSYQTHGSRRASSARARPSRRRPGRPRA